ncbi:MAG: DsbA family protein [Mesorhizobium sp.]|nr:MAG: DsbA family protein [Mesorhizobium sp.]
MSDKMSITVDVVSDVVCPWCFIGQKRLDKAIAAATDVEVHIRWRPFQLDPTIPPEGKDRRDYLVAKFGSDERIREIHARIEPLGEAEGINFAFAAIKVASNTLDAHRVIRWAGTAGEVVQNRLVRRLFQINAAREAGMDASVVETLLPTDADVEAVRTEIATASRMGITGVPCFLLEGKYAVMGAQDADTLTDAIRQVAAAKARGEFEKAN